MTVLQIKAAVRGRRPIHWVEAWVVRTAGLSGQTLYHIAVRNSRGLAGRGAGVLCCKTFFNGRVLGRVFRPPLPACKTSKRGVLKDPPNR